MDETTPAPALEGSSRKWLWIGLGILAVLILGAFFSGSVSRSIGLGAASVATGVDVDQNMDGSTTYTNEQGSVTVGTGASMPANWPSDAPTAYDNATIVYSGTTNPQTGEAGSAVAYTVSASAASVVEYYESRLRAEGWTITASAEAGGARVISATKDTRVMGVYVMTDAQGNTSVTAGMQL